MNRLEMLKKRVADRSDRQSATKLTNAILEGDSEEVDVQQPLAAVQEP